MTWRRAPDGWGSCSLRSTVTTCYFRTQSPAQGPPWAARGVSRGGLDAWFRAGSWGGFLLCGGRGRRPSPPHWLWWARQGSGMCGGRMEGEVTGGARARCAGARRACRPEVRARGRATGDAAPPRGGHRRPPPGRGRRALRFADATLAVPQDRAALTTPRSRFHDSGDPPPPCRGRERASWAVRRRPRVEPQPVPACPAAGTLPTDAHIWPVEGRSILPLALSFFSPCCGGCVSRPRPSSCISIATASLRPAKNMPTTGCRAAPLGSSRSQGSARAHGARRSSGDGRERRFHGTGSTWPTHSVAVRFRYRP